MPDFRRRGLAVVVGGRSGDGLALGVCFERHLAERGVLAAHEGGDQALRTADARLHGIDILAVAEQLCALLAGERVEIVAGDDVFRLLLAVVDVIPGAHHGAAVGLGEQSVELGEGDALRHTRTPDKGGLGAAHPASGPGVALHVVVEGREVGGGLGVGAVVVESGQLARMAIVKEQPVEEAQVNSLDESDIAMIGEGEAPDGEGV